MGKTNLKAIKGIVQMILEKSPKARNSDSFLYLKVLEYIASQKKDGFFLDRIPVYEFLMHRDEWGFPPFESVRRARQKIQSTCPWLAASAEVEQIRAENEHEYREFARG